MDVTTLVVALLALLLGVVLGALLAGDPLRGRRAPVDLREHVSAAATATSAVVAPVKESLDRFDARLRELEASRIEWHSSLREQVESVRRTGESLRRETSSLATALRKPQVRGRWGEMHLRKAVELAGLVDRCDFTEQLTIGTDTPQRPDLVVHLAGGRDVIVDSKVPLDAFLDATSTDDPQAHEAHLRRHARQLSGHVDALAAKKYWRALDSSPEFVVLFVPGEAFLSAALETEPGLLEQASERHVVLATPTTLIALLRTIAMAWREESVSASAREVQALGREVYDRLGTLGTHVDKLGRSLTAAVGSYNGAVASLETRVLVSARRMRDLQGDAQPLTAPRPVEDAVRPIAAPELLEDVGFLGRRDEVNPWAGSPQPEVDDSGSVREAG